MPDKPLASVPEMAQENTHISDDEDAPFVIEGVISELHVAPGRENLLKQIDKHYKGKSALTGLGAIAGGMHGQVANSAMLAMYEGEYTENFACTIGEQILCGTFAGASKLPMGKKIKAVVTKEGGVLKTHGIICESAGLVWVGYQWGWKAERAKNFKLAWWLFIFGILCITLCIVFLGVNPADSKLVTWLWGIFTAFTLSFGLALWNSSTMRTLADPATEIFRMLGFAEPEKVNLNSYSHWLVNLTEMINTKTTESVEQSRNVFYYQKAIDDGKVKMALPTKP